MAKVNLSPPWSIFYRQIEALFKEDAGVRVLFDDEAMEIKLYVEDAKKAAALETILPQTKEFGNVTVKVLIIPGNDADASIKIKKVDLFKVAFEGNGALAYVKAVQGLFNKPFIYVVFTKKVVQYYTDNLGDYHGIKSTLYQDLARDVFGDIAGIYYCTDVVDPNPIGVPLGEWP